MQIEYLYAKIHRATVTEANINYIGSITIDKTLLRASGMKDGMKVDVLDIDNGERFHTYIIEGEKDSGVVCLNGAAARKVSKGDKVIIVAYALMTEDESESFTPKIVHVDSENKIINLN